MNDTTFSSLVVYGNVLLQYTVAQAQAQAGALLRCGKMPATYFFFVFDDIGQHSTAEEHHMLSAWWILNPNFELSQLGCIVFEDALEVKLFDFSFKTTWQTGVHRGTTRKDDVFVEVGARVNISRLKVYIFRQNRWRQCSRQRPPLPKTSLFKHSTQHT